MYCLFQPPLRHGHGFKSPLLSSSAIYRCRAVALLLDVFVVLQLFLMSAGSLQLLTR